MSCHSSRPLRKKTSKRRAIDHTVISHSLVASLNTATVANEFFERAPRAFPARKRGRKKKERCRRDARQNSLRRSLELPLVDYRAITRRRIITTRTDVPTTFCIEHGDGQSHEDAAPFARPRKIRETTTTRTTPRGELSLRN